MNKDVKVYVAGHNGMVGSAIVRKLKENKITNIITRSHSELDLTNQQKVLEFIGEEKPDYIIIAAAKVGGIHANDKYPAQFIFINLAITTNIINAAHLAKVDKLLFLGSSCIYPKYAEQPMKESALLTGSLEPTNKPYAIAKIAGIEMCTAYNKEYGTDYRSVMPTNLYGTHDNYHGLNSHVIPAMLKRFHEAKINNDPIIEIWGSGNVCREFLYVDDMADACLFVLNLNREVYQEEIKSHINVGTGKDISIKELSYKIKEVVGYQGEIVFDTTKPEGTPRKLLNVSLLSDLGWKSKTNFEDGLKLAYEWMISNK